MAFHVRSRWGGDEQGSSENRMREILLVWENLEEGEPKHMNNVPRDRVLGLWIKLSEGRLDEIEVEPWLPGYEDLA
jgi:hypothetical protein